MNYFFKTNVMNNLGSLVRVPSFVKKYSFRSKTPLIDKQQWQLDVSCDSRENHLHEQIIKHRAGEEFLATDHLNSKQNGHVLDVHWPFKNNQQ